MTTGRLQGLAAITVAALLCLVAACGVGGSVGDGIPSAGPTSHEYRPGLAAFPHLPTGVTSAPVVVMVPGGGWVTADPSGFAGLADALARSGVVAVPVMIRAADDRVVFPVPVEDILCALADAAATARAAGITPTSFVLLGHSSGAHLAAVAALDPTAFTPSCADPLVRPDALVGLAGPYDIRLFADGAEALVGSPMESDPATWAAANPMLLARNRPELPVLLLHGEADRIVPPSASAQFAEVLRSSGHDVTVLMLPGRDHAGIYSPEAADPVAAWLRDLDAAAKPRS